MDSNKSLGPLEKSYIAILCDVQTSHSNVLTPRGLRLTIQKIEKRLSREGIGFLTKTLPRLGKAFDRALSGEDLLDAASLAFQSLPNSKLPKLFGELFQCVFSHDGRILPNPCVKCIKSLRQLLFIFYKLELPFDTSQEQKVLDQFIETDKELRTWNELFKKILECIDANPDGYRRITPLVTAKIIRNARKTLSRLFAHFDVLDIHPRHGPGAVSTKETLWKKYQWTCVPARIRQTYPLDAYFYASLGHVCDAQSEINSLADSELSAKVLLVPKDSRGPRLISCEPLAFQWVQQGLGRAITELVESHPLTRWSIHFTDQGPNQRGALLGSSTGSYATLDLKEASDRVSTGLVRLLFPEPVLQALLSCRSESTVMPSGAVIKLEKFAPMGSALCFPVMALVIWSLLYAGLTDADTFKGRKANENILVYGDDVIVPTAQAAYAIEILESFGLKVNRDKSFIKGLFRESCGVDAYKGESVTPVRFRTVWSSSRCPEVYTSYIAYANALYRLKFYQAYDYIVGLLTRTYGQIPEVTLWGLKPEEVDKSPVPSLVEVPEAFRPTRKRVNKSLQKLEWHVLTIKTPSITQEIGGWQMLLRFFAERTCLSPLETRNEYLADAVNRSHLSHMGDDPAFSVRRYTKRSTGLLVKRWR